MHKTNPDGFTAALAEIGVMLVYDIRASRPKWRRDGVLRYCDDRAMQALRYELADKVLMAGSKPDKPVSYWLKQETFYSLRDAVLFRAEFDPFQSWLEKLPPLELDTGAADDYALTCDYFLADAFSDVADDIYQRHISRSIALGAVWRTMQPGCPLHEVPVLKGPQGAGKDTIISHLLPELSWSTTSFTFAMSSKDRIDATRGKVFVIASEMGGVTTTKDLENMKSYITTPVDDCRMAYRRDSEVLPRRFIFVCTTNLDKPLPSDPTGNRRWCPLEVGPSQVGAVEPWIEARRETIWREAMALYKAGYSARLPRDLMDFQTNSNIDRERADDQMLDSYTDALAENHITTSGTYTLTDMAMALKLAESKEEWFRGTREQQHRLRDCLIREGWTNYRGRRMTGSPIERLWRFENGNKEV